MGTSMGTTKSPFKNNKNNEKVVLIPDRICINPNHRFASPFNFSCCHKERPISASCKNSIGFLDLIQRILWPLDNVDDQSSLPVISISY